MKREIVVPEWIQREVEQQEADERASARLRWTIAALIAASFAGAAWALWSAVR
ncbi:MAG: hypothetical protein ABIP41_09975 [Croceibacterium sp.]